MLPLTSQERKVFIFILCLIVFGIGVDFFKKKTHRQDLINYEQLKTRLFDKVDINRAPLSQLINIPGVGEALATRIIEYRRQHGDFATFDELKKVRGIKKKKLEKLKAYIMVADKNETTAPQHE